MKLDAMPIPGEWKGWCNIFPSDEAQRSTSAGHNNPLPTGVSEDDIPF